LKEVNNMMFYKETNFKDTPIGKIPKEWKLTKLGDITQEMFYGLTAKAVENETKFRMLRTTDIKDYQVDWNALPFCEITEKRSNVNRYFLKRGDLIIARAGTTGVSVLIKNDLKDVIFGSYLIKVKLKDQINPKFIHYFFQSKFYWRHITSSQAGSTLKNITLPILKLLQTPVPPTNEQEKIAEILSTVDEAIQKTNEVIAKTERLKRGLMQELLTKGIGHKEFKDSEIGRIPKKWKVVRLGEVIEVYDSERIPLSEMERNKRRGPYPYCGATGIIDWIDGYIFDGEFVLLVEDGGPFGKFENKAYIMSGKFWVNNHAHVLKAIYGRAENRFLLHLLNFLDLNPQIVGSTRKKLNQEHMKRITIPLPPVQEQQKIAEILSTIDKKLELERKEKARLERIKQGMMDLLLTGKIRVKVN